MSAANLASKIVRHEPEGGLLSNAVAADGFVTCVSMADDLGLDIAGQTRQVLAYVDHCLGLAGTDRDRLVQVTIWLTDIRDRDAMNRIWTEWLVWRRALVDRYPGTLGINQGAINATLSP